MIRMPYGRQAVAKPIVTRRARPDGEDAKTFEEVCANDPLTAAAIRAALIGQNTPAVAFVGGSPSKRTVDALVRALAEDPNREEEDAPGALSARTKLEVPHRGPSLFSAAIIRAAVLAALMLLLVSCLYSSPSTAAGSTAAASASAGGRAPHWLNRLGRQLQRLGRERGFMRLE